MYSVYIDHPDFLGAYEFLPGDKDGNDVVSRKLGIKVKFVCNSYAKISDGDVYEVQFENEEDAIAFILKCRYKILKAGVVERYRQDIFKM